MLEETFLKILIMVLRLPQVEYNKMAKTELVYFNVFLKLFPQKAPQLTVPLATYQCVQSSSFWHCLLLLQHKLYISH